ncbi:hypothetical protein BD310DRAFT_980685 [Dichomitus squalens]|uniref:Uncharacterized protein n=1 Tax=Dichomitus squalens TaxID=114155 RepID=A0A4Q9PIX8_9APHY|nr:hypothetical protein BD310DRAFT_980685 [Dichomitus squalens]
MEDVGKASGVGERIVYEGRGAAGPVLQVSPNPTILAAPLFSSKSSTIPGTPPIEKQQQLLAQLEAVQQQIWEDEERAERDRAEREKVEREQRAREEVELLERERARLQKKLAERRRAEKERAGKERARKPTSGRVESPQKFSASCPTL